MFVGGEGNGVCWIGVELEGNGWVDLFRVSRVLSGFLKTDQIISDLVLALIEELGTTEKLRDLATDVA